MKKLIIALIAILLTTNVYSQTYEELEIQLEKTTNELISLTEDYIDLLKEYDLVIDQLEETTNALEETTDILIDNTAELIQAQTEIKSLREDLEVTIIPAYTQNLFSIGVGYTMPDGIELIFDIDIPNFFLGFYGRVNYQFKNNANLGIGVKIDL